MAGRPIPLDLLRLRSATAAYLSVTRACQLAAEALNFARVRETKSRRFKHALRSVFVFYAWSVAAFLMLRDCGAAVG